MHVYIYIHTHMSAYMCVCVCMYVNICNMYVCYLLDLAYNSAIKANKQINTHTQISKPMYSRNGLNSKGHILRHTYIPTDR